MRMCERLAELGMDLAEAAHREALRELQPPQERRRHTMPGFPEMPGLPTPSFFRDDTCGLLFTQLSRCVRQAILLEARIDGGAYDHPTPSAGPIERIIHAEPDPFAAPRPHGTGEATRITHERVEDDLAAEANRSAPEIIARIGAELQALTETVHPHSSPTPSQPRTPTILPLPNPPPPKPRERPAQQAPTPRPPKPK